LSSAVTKALEFPSLPVFAPLPSANGDHVRTLSRTAGRDGGGGVVPVADAGLDGQAVDLVAPATTGRAVAIAAWSAAPLPPAPLDLQVVAVTGLVEQFGDEAGGAGAEGVLRGGVRGSARGQRVDVLGAGVGQPLDLVERAVVGGVESADRAVRGDARVAYEATNHQSRRCLDTFPNTA
jgi:hypothetical protein